MRPDRSIEFGYTRAILLDANDQFAAYLRKGQFELQLLPVGGDHESRAALLTRLPEGVRREVAAAYDKLRRALFDDGPLPTSLLEGAGSGGIIYDYPQLLRLLRQVRVQLIGHL